MNGTSRPSSTPRRLPAGSRAVPNVAIVHYHLRPSGVTRAIAGHIEALRAAGAEGSGLRVAVMCGREGEDGRARRLPLEAPVVEVPGLEYDAEDARPQPAELARRLHDTLEAIGFAPRRTVLHVHNHGLGKNLSLPGALGELARRGYALLLHIHDFAEDYRPADYRRLAECARELGGAMAALVYPQGPAVHYAVLNNRDRAILRRAGMAGSRLHLLPNTVRGPAVRASRRAARTALAGRGVPADALLLVYPVRGIRRKNLGEALLWAALAPSGARLGVTLAPATAAEQPAYRSWRSLAVDLGLPCLFELGERAELGVDEMLAAADRILTTSVAEGFGLVFLEACLAERPLVGRDLPEITADFRAAGVRFPGLRPQLWVPLRWVGRDAFLAEFATAYHAVLESYGRLAPASGRLRPEIARLLRGGRVDFARLTPAQQRRVVETAASAAGGQRLRRANPWIRAALAGGSDAVPDRWLERNAAAARERYSPAASGPHLLALYRRVAASPRGGRLWPLRRAEAILDEFLTPGRFHPLRAEP